VRGHDDWQLVMTVSAGLEPDALGPLPASAIVVQHAPQLDLLRRAAVMLTAGGFNSLKECIVLGTPFVLFPMATDQPGNAARVRAHGIALTASLRRSTPPQIAELIRRTLDDSAMRARLRAMQAVFQRDDASDLAIRTIEGLARTAPREVPDRGIA
jgi:zeaxanthin glucosyltransferase